MKEIFPLFLLAWLIILVVRLIFRDSTMVVDICDFSFIAVVIVYMVLKKYKKI
ncbi:hypothetical protein [Peribacillus muralis]|uniref:hypothetical protein n=1 Tax=Peribacillus muralis TaxID=264697 RepID=UPI000AB7DBC9|nr:hypothetical protein [Peribacillus muralis]